VARGKAGTRRGKIAGPRAGAECGGAPPDAGAGGGCRGGNGDPPAGRGHAVALANRLQPPGPLDDFGWSGPVVVVSAEPRVGQDATVEDAAADDRDATLGAEGEQLLEPGLV